MSSHIVVVYTYWYFIDFACNTYQQYYNDFAIRLAILQSINLHYLPSSITSCSLVWVTRACNTIHDILWYSGMQSACVHMTQLLEKVF